MFLNLFQVYNYNENLILIQFDVQIFVSSLTYDLYFKVINVESILLIAFYRFQNCFSVWQAIFIIYILSINFSPKF